MKGRKEILTHYPDIFKIVVFDQKSGKWIEPKFGKKFKARRYVYTSDGRRLRLKRSFDTIAEAKAFRNGTSLEQELELTQGSKEKMTLGELIEHWKRDWLPSKELTTQLQYKSYLKHYEFLWHKRVDAIDPSMIDQWLAHIKKPEYVALCHSTRCSYEHELTVLRIILNYYSSRIDRNYRLPFIKSHNDMIKVKNKASVKKDLTVEQFKAFIEALRELCLETKWEAIYYMALMQYGIYGRIQDAAALYFESFDFVKNSIEINRKVQWIRRRGYEDRIVEGSKTDGGKTLSPIPELAERVFHEWIEKTKIQSGPLFLIEGKIITYRQIEHKYSQALKKANLPFSATHIIRHAALSEAYDSCKDILLVQRFAGQKDLRSTMRYAKVRDVQVTETQKKIDEKLASILEK